VKLLGDDDLNLREATWEELEAAWELWFDLAQHTNDHDPPYTHGVFVRLRGLQEERTAPSAPLEPRPMQTPPT
jgi:hypothetical protein